MLTLILSILFYVIGYLLAYWMLKIEHLSEKRVFTKGDVVIGTAFSFLSWIAVAIALISAWFKQIKLTGYWDQPAKNEK